MEEEKNTKIKHLKFLSSFWKKIGSKVVIMDTKKHDKIFSITSHLPHLIAYNLVKSAQDFEKKQKFDLIKYVDIFSKKNRQKHFLRNFEI